MTRIEFIERFRTLWSNQDSRKALVDFVGGGESGALENAARIMVGPNTISNFALDWIGEGVLNDSR